jgi:hypothetical protein
MVFCNEGYDTGTRTGVHVQTMSGRLEGKSTEEYALMWEYDKYRDVCVCVCVWKGWDPWDFFQ